VKEILIVALDCPKPDENERLVERLGDRVIWYKVGSSLFIRRGPDLVERLLTAGKHIFLDLKFHDIPNTVAQSVAGASELGVRLLTVHGSAGPEVLKAAAEASGDVDVLVVTALTSRGGDVLEEVRRIAASAAAAGCAGVICSPHEAATVRADRGADFAIVTPGIRFSGPDGDQARVATPSMAVSSGATHIVVGRPIYRSADSIAAVEAIYRDLEQ
jgi:orotidine-5'-phosphate decarboxylase